MPEWHVLSPKPGLRVIAGAARGIRLSTPPGRDLRPTQDRVREALFSIIGPSIEGARFLDLYAGSGANGIEALSRGAALVKFLDHDVRSIDCIAGNLDRLGQDVGGMTSLLRAELPQTLPGGGGDAGFDFVFTDPPYALNAYEAIATTVAERETLSPGGWLIMEHESGHAIPERAFGDVLYIRTAKYGSTSLSIYERQSSP